MAQRAVQDKQMQVSVKVEDKSSSLLRMLEGKEELPPTATSTPATTQSQHPAQLQQQQQPEKAIPIMKTLDPPPPSFDSMKFPPPTNLPVVSDEMVGHGMNSRVLSSHTNVVREVGREVGREGGIAPPSFDFVEQQQQQHLGIQSNIPPAPTAPEVSPTEDTQHSTIDHLHGILPVAAPPLLPNDLQQQQQGVDAPPPSYNMFESQQQQSSSDQQTTATSIEDEDDVLAYDENGNPLSPQQRQSLLDEQRLLYENIMKEKAANDAAIARANADAFDLRSSNAVARVAGGGASTTLADSNRVMDSVGRDVASTSDEGQSESLESEEARRRESRRMVKIGNNQMVALHGQDRTKKAIKEGTAILVQCINCQNWMQVTESATLMFCPVCQVVSPVIQQTEVMTKEEAIQLTMDRKLAEKLQAEAYAQNEQQGESSRSSSRENQEEEEGFLGRFFGGIGGAVIDATEGAAGAISSSMSSSNTTTEERSDSWWNKISSIVSYGEPAERSDLGVTRPPGAPPSSSSQYPASAAARQQRSSSTTTSPSSRNEETRGLLSPVVVDGNEEHHLPAGRVAEQRPLFSCVADSISSATAAVFHTGDDDDNVHGVDASSLLVTSAGRGVGDGEGDYSRLESDQI